MLSPGTTYVLISRVGMLFVPLHGARNVNRKVNPSLIGESGPKGRRIPAQGESLGQSVIAA